MSEELREEIARALYEHDPGWDPEPWAKTNARMRAAYRVSADAIMPIIARVRDEAREAGYYQGVDEGYKRACLNRQSPF